MDESSQPRYSSLARKSEVRFAHSFSSPNSRTIDIFSRDCAGKFGLPHDHSHRVPFLSLVPTATMSAMTFARPSSVNTKRLPSWSYSQRGQLLILNFAVQA